MFMRRGRDNQDRQTLILRIFPAYCDDTESPMYFSSMSRRLVGQDAIMRSFFCFPSVLLFRAKHFLLS